METADNGRPDIGRPALTGVTVLDLGQAFMGPYCGLLLQRLGAEVIKVEPPQGEPYRRPTVRKGTEAMQFGLLNAGKRSLSIDLKNEDGRRLFTELAETADVVIQNYAPKRSTVSSTSARRWKPTRASSSPRAASTAARARTARCARWT